MWKGACQVVRSIYFRGIQREDCSLFLALTQTLPNKTTQPFLESHCWGVVAVCSCHSSPSQQFKKKKGSRGNQEWKQGNSVFKCRNTLRNKIRNYRTTEGRIFFYAAVCFLKNDLLWRNGCQNHLMCISLKTKCTFRTSVTQEKTWQVPRLLNSSHTSSAPLKSWPSQHIESSPIKYSKDPEDQDVLSTMVIILLPLL